MKKIVFISIIASAIINTANASVDNTDTASASMNKTKWYFEGGLGLGYGKANSEFDANDWCNSAGCVSGYWDTFDYPGSSQSKNLGNKAVVFGAFKFGRQYESFSFGAYGDIGNPSSALGIYAEFGTRLLVDIGVGIAHNSIFDKSAVDVRFGIGYPFKLTETLSLIPSAFLGFQISSNGSAEGQGYTGEGGGECYSCWARGTEMLYYYNGGIKTTLRYSF